MPTPGEDRFLGALLGLAVGDALGMPVAGLDRAEIARRHGPIRTYLPRPLPDGGSIAAGEITEQTETVLAIVEGLTTNQGRLDPDLVGPRLVHLAQGESRRWFPPGTLAALDRAADTLEFRAPLDEDGPAPTDLAVRGIPVGLLHAVGGFDPRAMAADAEDVVRLTHGSTAAIAAATAVAAIVRAAARDDGAPRDWGRTAAEGLGGGALAERLADLDLSAIGPAAPADLDALAATGDAAGAISAALTAAARAERFTDAVFPAVDAGGAANAVGALAGAFAGARFGSRGIPQPLIDGLGARIYVSLAAPWFLKAAQRRAGTVIDLRPRLGGPRPDLPPRY